MDAPGDRQRRGLETRELFLLAFFATGLVLARAALRWHLHVSGHSMFATALLLVLARACVQRPGAATIAGALAGAACAALGMGKGGPLLVLKLALPGAMVDVGAALAPAVLVRPLLAASLGAVAGATDFLPVAIVELLADLPLDVVLWHAALSAGAKAAFGAAGAAAGAAIAVRLRHHGLLPGDLSARPRERPTG
jgi:hypothetical protein